MLIATFYYTINCLATGTGPIQRREENQNTTGPGQKLVTLPSLQPFMMDPSLESGLSPLNSRLETGQAVKLMIGRHMDDDDHDDDAQKEINQFDSGFALNFCLSRPNMGKVIHASR